MPVYLEKPLQEVAYDGLLADDQNPLRGQLGRRGCFGRRNPFCCDHAPFENETPVAFRLGLTERDFITSLTQLSLDGAARRTTGKKLVSKFAVAPDSQAYRLKWPR